MSKKGIKIKIPGTKNATISIFKIIFVELIIIVCSIYVGACWHKEFTLSATMEWLPRFIDNPTMVFNRTYMNANMLWLYFFLSGAWYLYELCAAFSKKKYIKNKEFGSAEFADAEALNEILRNKDEDPSSPNMMLYIEE